MYRLAAKSTAKTIISVLLLLLFYYTCHIYKLLACWSTRQVPVWMFYEICPNWCIRERF